MSDFIFIPEKNLFENGVIIGQAQRRHESLTYFARQRIMANRRRAEDMGMSQRLINAIEMDGIQDQEASVEPIKIKAVFAFWNEGYQEIAAFPSYVIRESNHPDLVVHSHVGKEELEKAGVKIPKTPSYDKWVKDGKKVVRS